MLRKKSIRRLEGVAGLQVQVTAALDTCQWLYHLKLHGTHDFGGGKVGIPEGVYQINLEIASTAGCGDGAHVTGAYTADYANGRPVMELHWDLGRGTEPSDPTVSPEGAMRDPATGAVAAWRVLPIDAGKVPYENRGNTYTDIPVKLYVATIIKYFDEDGNVVEDYRQVPGVELCTGEVHQLIDADYPWPGQVTTTCDQTYTDEATLTVSSDPAGAWVWGGSYDGPLGISVGITKAPSEPGDYYLVAEPLDETFRRGQSWKVDHGIGWPRPVVRFTVMGGVFLDESYAPADPFVVEVPVQAYLRLVGVDLGTGNVTVPVTTFAQDGSVLSQDVPVQLSGGPESGYLGPITLNPEGYVSGASAPTGPVVQAGLGQGKVHAKVNGKTVARTSTAFPGKLTIRFMTRDGSQIVPPVDGNPAHAGLKQETEIGDNTDEYAEIVHLRIAAENPYDPTQPSQNWNGEVGLKEAKNTHYFPGDNTTPDDQHFYLDDGHGTTVLDPSGRVDGSFLKMTVGTLDVVLKAATRVRHDRANKKVTVHPPYVHGFAAKISAVVVNARGQPAPHDSAEVEVDQWVDERDYLRRRGNPTAGLNPNQAGNNCTDWLEKKVWDAQTDYNAAPGTETDAALDLVTKIQQDFTIGRAGEVQCSPGSNPVVCQTVHWNPALETVRYGQWGANTYESGYRTETASNQDAFLNLIVHEARHCWQYDLVVRQQSPLKDDDNDLAPESPPASALELRDAHYGAGSNQNHEFDMAGDQSADPPYVVKGALERDALRMAADAEGNTLTCSLQEGPEPFSSSVVTGTVGIPVTCTAMPDAWDWHFTMMHPAGIPIRWAVARTSGAGDCKLQRNGNLCPDPCITTSDRAGTTTDPATASIDVVATGPAVCSVDAYHLVPVPDDGCPNAGNFPAHFTVTFN